MARTPDDDINLLIRCGLSKCGRGMLNTIAKKGLFDGLQGKIAAGYILEELRLAGYDVVTVKPPSRVS